LAVALANADSGTHRRYRITEGSEEIQKRQVAAFLFGYMGPPKR
jgi:acyl-CoA dehydrogenase